MPTGKNHTQRLESLESLTANMSARIDVLNNHIGWITELLKKCRDTGDGHGSKITIIEQQLLIVDLKTVVATIGAIREELTALKKDIEAVQSWKAEQKKEKEEAARRLWSFGPNIAAAVISGLIAILGVVLNVGLTYYLNRSK